MSRLAAWRLLRMLPSGTLVVLLSVVPAAAAAQSDQPLNTHAVQPLTTMDDRPAAITRVECVSPERLEIEITSTELFPVRNAILELHVGPVTTGLSSYSVSGDLYTIIFLLEPADLDQISTSDEALVGFNPGFDDMHWQAGVIDPAEVRGCDQASSVSSMPRSDG